MSGTYRSAGRQAGPHPVPAAPHWHVDPARLEAFLESLGRRHRYAFEFRDPNWFDKSIQRVLEKHDAAFCIYDLAGQLSPRRSRRISSTCACTGRLRPTRADMIPGAGGLGGSLLHLNTAG
ncbi:DUF72 domain-containing protein [Thiobacillus sp.]